MPPNQDIGLTHIALMMTNPEASIAFYEKYAAMQVVHRRVDTATGRTVLWLSDRTRPFVIVLIETDKIDAPLRPLAHLGVGCPSRG
jgi:catechol 2,3-dioxygenase-like lactoylglutathione lyase family enzyme